MMEYRNIKIQYGYRRRFLKCKCGFVGDSSELSPYCKKCKTEYKEGSNSLQSIIGRRVAMHFDKTFLFFFWRKKTISWVAPDSKFFLS